MNEEEGELDDEVEDRFVFNEYWYSLLLFWVLVQKHEAEEARRA